MRETFFFFFARLPPSHIIPTSSQRAAALPSARRSLSNAPWQTCQTQTHPFPHSVVARPPLPPATAGPSSGAPMVKSNNAAALMGAATAVCLPAWRAWSSRSSHPHPVRMSR